MAQRRAMRSSGNVHTSSGVTLLHAGTTLRADHIRDLARHEAGGELELPVQVFRPLDAD
jgi:hypothetical protein